MYAVLLTVTAQIVLTNIVFVVYVASNDWRVDGATIQVWLAAASAQVVGLAACWAWGGTRARSSPSTRPCADQERQGSWESTPKTPRLLANGEGPLGR